MVLPQTSHFITVRSRFINIGFLLLLLIPKVPTEFLHSVKQIIWYDSGIIASDFILFLYLLHDMKVRIYLSELYSLIIFQLQKVPMHFLFLRNSLQHDHFKYLAIAFNERLSILSLKISSIVSPCRGLETKPFFCHQWEPSPDKTPS